MKLMKPMVLAIALVAGLMTINLIAQSNSSSSRSAQRANVSQELPRFEYATLSSQVFVDVGRTNYELVWNAGVQDFFGRSNNSLTEARQRLSAQLGIPNAGSRTNLSVLLTGLGGQGWRLVESTETESGTTRIFIRSAR